MSAAWVKAFPAGRPLALVDVGASGGVHPRWQVFGDRLKAVLFEPDPRAYRELQTMVPAHWTVINTALADAAGTIDLHLCRKQKVSSVYPPNTDLLRRFPDASRFDLCERRNMAADTLDAVLPAHGVGEVDFIKVDAEGFELAILRGAGQTLANVIGVEVEVCFQPLRIGQPLFDEIHRHLSSIGLTLFDLRRQYWRLNGEPVRDRRKGQLVWGDALYLRPASWFMGDGTGHPAKALMALMVYQAYNYPDLVADLLGRLVDAGCLEKGQQKRLQLALNRAGRLPNLPPFRGRGRICQLLHRLADLFADTGPFTGGDEQLGN